MEIYKSPYQTVNFDEDNKLAIQVFTSKTEEYTKENYKKDMLNFLTALEKASAQYIVAKVIVDMRKMKYPVNPQLQEWHNNTIFSRANELNLQKMAIVVSPDLFTHVSVEQPWMIETMQILNQNTSKMKRMLLNG